MAIDSPRIDSDYGSNLRDQPGLSILIIRTGSDICRALCGTPPLCCFQTALQKFFAAKAALNLAAGSSRDTSRCDQDNLVDLNFVFFGNRFTNTTENLIGFQFLPPRDLLNQDHALAAAG